MARNAGGGHPLHGTHEWRLWFRVAVAILGHPALWAEAARQVAQAVPQGWWRRRPFVPVPDRAYLRFRFETAYGTHGRPVPADVVAFLKWARAASRRTSSR